MHRILSCLALLLLTVPAFAAEPAGLSGSVPSGVLRATLPNGLRVVVVPDRLAPVVTTELCYLAGSNDAPDGFPGTAHALEHMMFRGSEGLDRDQLAELGQELGGAYNASTTETVTQYTYTVPAADLGLVLRIEALRMRGLTINQADWEQERGAIGQEVSRDLSSPFYLYLAQLRSILFAGSPYEHDALGTRDSFDHTDATLLRQFYERWYAPNNAILVIAGDVVPDVAMAQAAEAFGGIASRPVPAHPLSVLTTVTPQTIALPTNFSTGIVGIAVRMPGLTSRDFATADILGDVLGSQRGALYGLVPAGRALSAQYTFQALPGAGIGLAIAAFPTGADPAPLITDMRRVLQAAADGDIPPELVEASKRQELAQLAFANDSISGLASSWARALSQQDLQSPEDVAQAYAAVTVADVVALAHSMLDLDHAVTAVLTPRREGAAPSAGGFGGAESFASVPDHEVTLPGWAAGALTELRLPPLVTPPDVSVLPNGLRLIVQPEHVSRTVSIYGRIRQVADMQEPPGKEGLATLTSQLFSYGTATRDRLALRKAFDDIAATETAGPGFALKVLTPEFEHGMQLLAENELNPAFDETDFRIVRQQLAQSRNGLLQSPDYRARYAANAAIVPPQDPTLRQATAQTVGALTLDDVRAFHAAAYRPDLTTIVVLGDVTPEEARRVVLQTFGPWQASGPAPAIDLPPIADSAASRARIADPGTLQERVTLTTAIDVPVLSPDRYTLMLGNSILGSGFSSRLYRDLRVKTGYVYSVSSALDWSRTRADYTVAFGADQANVDKARALVVRDIRDMQETPVSEAELRRAKAQVLRQLPMQRANVGAIAGLYLRLMELGQPLNAEDIAARFYRDVTADQIRTVFATKLRPDALAEIVQGPPAAP